MFRIHKFGRGKGGERERRRRRQEKTPLVAGLLSERLAKKHFELKENYILPLLPPGCRERIFFRCVIKKNKDKIHFWTLIKKEDRERKKEKTFREASSDACRGIG